MFDYANVEFAFKKFLQASGDDHLREGLVETPKRAVRAWKEWLIGYDYLDPSIFLKVFDESNYDEMVFQGNISFYSICEHHLCSFFGVAHIAYIPHGKIVGLSKLSRTLEIFTRRLQVQERITSQVADVLKDNLSPDIGVVLRARHTCMESRGIQKVGTTTITTALRGTFKDEDSCRAEFMQYVNVANLEMRAL